jgi:hypothetical protein
MEDTKHIREMLDSERPLFEFVKLVQGYFVHPRYLNNPHFTDLPKILNKGVPWVIRTHDVTKNTPAQGGVVRVTAAQRAAQSERNWRECPEYSDQAMQAFLRKAYYKSIKMSQEKYFLMRPKEEDRMIDLREFYGMEVRPKWHEFEQEFKDFLANENNGQSSPVLRLVVGG